MPNPMTGADANPLVFKPIKALAITSGSPQAVWTPATGKRLRLLGFCVNPTAAASILFEDATSWTNSVLRFSLTAAVPTTPVPANLCTNRHHSLLLNNTLFLDVTDAHTL